MLCISESTIELPAMQTENETWKRSPCLPALNTCVSTRVRISINFVYNTSITWNSPQSPSFPLCACPWLKLPSLRVQFPHPHFFLNLWCGTQGRGWDSGQNLGQKKGMENAAFLGKSDGSCRVIVCLHLGFSFSRWIDINITLIHFPYLLTWGVLSSLARNKAEHNK